MTGTDDSERSPLIRTSALGMVYESKRRRVEVLRGINIEIKRGDFVAILGSSGAGKSTLLRLLAGLQLPTSGTLTVGDVEVTSLDEDAAARFRHRHVGIVFQFFNLLPMLDVEENVALPLLMAGTRLSATRARVGALLEHLGIAQHRTSQVQRLSGGQLQRVAIARALVTAPQLILADEPTGNLDARLGTEMFGLLRELCKERSITTVVMTHDLRVASFANRLIRLRNGEIDSDVSTDNVPEHV